MDLSFEDVKTAPKKVVGTKQTVKSIHNGEAKVVLIAEDAEEKIVKPIIEVCEEKGIDWVYMGTMPELGRACGIKVGAATAALIDR